MTLSDASEDHIKTAHPELKDRLERIAETIEQPEIVRPSKFDGRTKVYYRQYEDGKYLCVPVKYLDSGAFVLTAYETRNVR